MASNRFDFLKQPQQDDDQQDVSPTEEIEVKPVKQSKPKSKSVAIPGLGPKDEEKVVLERLNVEIPADLHQQLKEYCTATRRTKKEVITALIEFLISESGG